MRTTNSLPMERLQCKACGAFGLVPMDVEEIEIDDEISDEFGLSTGTDNKEDDVELEDFEDFENI